MQPALSSDNSLPDTAPGGYLYLVAKAREELLYGSAGSRSLNLQEHINRHTTFRMASLSKQYTAAAVLRAIKEQKLKGADALKQYWPTLPPAVGDVTVTQLLNHTSGIIDYENLLPPTSDTQVTDQAIWAMIQSRGELYFQPGSRFRYSNTGYCLLAQLLETSYAQPFPLLLQRMLFEPGQLAATVYQRDQAIAQRAYGFRKSDTGTIDADQNITSATQGDGGVYTSLKAYHKWIQLLFSGKLIRGYTRLLFGSGQSVVQRDVAYHLGWFISREQDGSPCVFHSGESTGFRHVAYYVPKKKILCVLFSNTEGWEQELSDRFEALLHLAKCRPRLRTPLFQWMSRIYTNT